MKRMFLMVIMCFLFAAEGFAQSYTELVFRNLSRGFINIISAPLEIPITMQDYHESPGYPVVRHTEGLFDGTFQMVERAGSGLWDWVVAFVPGDQDGLPADPETLF